MPRPRPGVGWRPSSSKLLVQQTASRGADRSHNERYLPESSASSGSPPVAQRTRGKDEHELLGSQADGGEGGGDIRGVGETELTGAGLDQGEEVVAVLGGGEVHSDARVVTPELADHLAVGSAASVGRLARDKRPRQSPGTAATAARPVSRSRRTWRAGPSRADPAAVSRTRWPIRVKSWAPTSASRSLTASDNAGWETKTALAAAVNPPWSTTATKWASLRLSICTAYRFRQKSLFDF